MLTQDNNWVPNDAQRIWVATPAYLIVICFLAGLIFLIPLSIAMEWVGLDPFEPLPESVLQVLFYLIPVTCLWVVSRGGKGFSSFSLGESIDRSALVRAILLAIPLLGMSLALFYAIYVPLSFLFPEMVSWWLLDRPSFIWLSLDYELLVASMVNIFAMIVFAPFVEEIVFRGYLLHRLTVKFGPIIAISFSSLIFGLIHVDFVGAFIFGVVLSCMALHSNSLIGPIVTHACNNLIVVIVVLGDGFYQGEISGTMSLQELREFWWVGAVAGLVAFPWLIHAWRSRLEIRPRQWSQPLIETFRSQM